MIPILYNNYPSIDLHGLDRDYARILINEFIDDCYKMKKERLVIIHGNGNGILRKMTQEVLKKNKLVAEFKIDNFNSGTTIVALKNNWK